MDVADKRGDKSRRLPNHHAKSNTKNSIWGPFFFLWRVLSSMWGAFFLLIKGRFWACSLIQKCLQAPVDKTDNTEQLQRFINNLWQHQQKNEFCDISLTTNNTSIECHKLVLSSASSYFSQLLCDSEHNTNIIDVTPLPENILRTVVAFMYNSEYVINDENVIELLKFSGTWNLDILAQLCVTYMNDNITINNACRFYSIALDNVGQNKSQVINEFIREHFTSLHESGQLSELSLKNFTTIIKHDAINVKNEDVIFSTAVQIINQQTSVEDTNRCLEFIRFPHTSGDFLMKVIRNHPLMTEPPRDRYVSDAILYQRKQNIYTGS